MYSYTSAINKPSDTGLKIIFVFVLFLLVVRSYGQSRTIDSLKHSLNIASQDTQICKLYYEIGRAIYNQYSDSALPYFEKSVRLAEKNLEHLKEGGAEWNSFVKSCANAYKGLALVADVRGDNRRSIEYCEKSYELRKKRNDLKGMADILNNMGNSYDQLGEGSRALKYHNQSLELRRKINHVEGIAQSLSNIGNVYFVTGNLAKAIEHYSEAIKILQNSDFKKEYAHVLLSMSFIYARSGDKEKALEYIKQSLELNKQRNDKNGMAAALLEMGNIYFYANDHKKAKPLYQEAIDNYESVGNLEGAATAYNSMAGVYFTTGDIASAAEWLKKAIAVCEKSGDKNMLAATYGNLAEIYLQQGEKQKGIEMLLKAKQMGLESGSPLKVEGAANMLYNEYKSSGNYKQALEHYELYVKMKDSLSNESARKAIMKAQLKYEYEIKAAADSVAHAKQTEVKNAELARQKAEIKASRNQRYALFGGLILVMLFAGVMYNRFKVTSKQKTIIGNQKIIVEEKQKEILASIHYAKRIQQSLLPTTKYIERNLKRLRDETKN
jgi:tetratricopeptide (TPR) repeat protein